jgi:hypothetical protein
MLNQSKYADHKNNAHGMRTGPSVYQSTDVSVLRLSFRPVCNTGGGGLEDILATRLAVRVSCHSVLFMRQHYSAAFDMQLPTGLCYGDAMCFPSNIIFTDFST